MVPIESSPLYGKALSELFAGGGVTAAVGYLVGHPLLVFEVGGGMIVCGAARGVAEALRIGLRSKLLDLMGVDDPDREPADDETL